MCVEIALFELVLNKCIWKVMEYSTILFEYTNKSS